MPAMRRVETTSSIARFGILVLCLSLAPAALAVAGVHEGAVSRVAGSGAAGVTDGVGTTAEFSLASGCAPDMSAWPSTDGYIVADKDGHTLRYVNTTSGIVLTYAGQGGAHGNGVGSPATNSLRAPTDVFYLKISAADAHVYVTDSLNHRIVHIDPSTKYLSQFAGSGTGASSDGAGIGAGFNTPFGLTGDSAGAYLYVAEQGGNMIRRVNRPTADVTTFAGHPTEGFQDGVGTAAAFRQPQHIVFRNSEGSMYIAGIDYRLRRADAATAIVSTVAGRSGATDDPAEGFGSNESMPIGSPSALAIDPTEEYLYVAIQDKGAVWRFVFASGYYSRVIGSSTTSAAVGTITADANPHKAAVFAYGLCASLANGESAELFLSGQWQVGAAVLALQQRQTRLLAGRTSGTLGFVDGPGLIARFNRPTGCAVDQSSGSAYIADRLNHRIRGMTNPSQQGNDGKVTITTVVGNGTAGSGDDVTEPSVGMPAALFFHDQAVFWADATLHCIRMANITTGAAYTLAGLSETSGYAEGAAPVARFTNPQSLDLDPSSTDQAVFIADTGNNRIRKLKLTTNDVSNYAGSGIAGATNGSPGIAAFQQPRGVKVRVTTGQLFVLDTMMIRMIASSQVSTVAGQATAGTTDGVGTAASFTNLAASCDFDRSYLHLFVVDHSAIVRRFTLDTRVVETLFGASNAAAADASFDTSNPFRSSGSFLGLCASHSNLHGGPERLFVVGEHFVAEYTFGETNTATTTTTASLVASRSFSHSYSVTQTGSTTQAGSTTRTGSTTQTGSTTHTGLTTRTDTTSLTQTVSFRTRSTSLSISRDRVNTPQTKTLTVTGTVNASTSRRLTPTASGGSATVTKLTTGTSTRPTTLSQTASRIPPLTGTVTVTNSHGTVTGSAATHSKSVTDRTTSATATAQTPTAGTGTTTVSSSASATASVGTATASVSGTGSATVTQSMSGGSLSAGQTPTASATSSSTESETETRSGATLTQSVSGGSISGLQTSTASGTHTFHELKVVTRTATMTNNVTGSTSLSVTDSGTYSDTVSNNGTHSVSSSMSLSETTSNNGTRSARPSTTHTITTMPTVSAKASPSVVATPTGTRQQTATPTGSQHRVSPTQSATQSGTAPTASHARTPTQSKSPSASSTLEQALPPAATTATGGVDPRLFFPPLYFLPAGAAASWQGKRVLVTAADAAALRRSRMLAWRTVGFANAVRVHVADTQQSGWSIGLGSVASDFCNASASQAPTASSCGTLRLCDTQQAQLPVSGSTSLALTIAAAFATGTSCSSTVAAHIFVTARGGFAADAAQYAWAELASTTSAVPTGWTSTSTTTVVEGASAVSLQQSAISATATSFVLAPASTARSADTAAKTMMGAAGSCILEDLQSYTVFTGRGTGPTLACAVSSGGTVRACTTIVEAITACNALSACTGFTAGVTGDAALAGSLVEAPIHLHTTTFDHAVASAADVATLAGSNGLGVAFHRKALEAQRRCSFAVAAGSAPSTLRVLLSQAAMADGTVAVYARNGTDGDRQLAAECGGSARFAGARVAGAARGTFGRNSACDELVLCTEMGAMEAGSTLEVVAPAGLQQRACDTPLRVVVTSDTQAPVSTRTTQLRAALVFDASVPDLQDVTGTDIIDVSVPLTAAGSGLAASHVFVLDASNVSLKVNQTGYECNAAATSSSVPACPSRPAVVLRRGVAGITAATALAPGAASTLMSCGGNTTFSERPGLTAWCDRAWDCAPAPVAAATGTATTYDGVVSVAADAGFIGQATQPSTASAFCTGFAATLHVNGPQTTRVRRVGRFPFASPLIPGTSEEAWVSFPATTASSTMADATADGATTLVTNALVGASGTAVSLYKLHNASLSNGAPVLSEANVTRTCVFDTVTFARECVVPVPTSALKLAVRVAQTDFATSSIVVVVRDASGSPLERKVCGGSAARPFGLADGLDGACNTFLSCIVDSYMPVGAASVSVSVPAGLRSNGCPVAMMSELEFNTPAADAASAAGSDGSGTSTATCDRTTHYVCRADRRCIPLAAICDGAQSECPDGADELPCGQYRHAESNVQWSVTTNASSSAFGTSVPSAGTIAECRRYAVFLGIDGFVFSFSNASASAFDPVSPECYVFSRADVLRILASPTAAIASMSAPAGRASLTYFLAAERADYLRCSATLHCSDHGSIRGEPADGSGCECDCNQGWGGTACDLRRSVGEPAGYYALLTATPSLYVRALYEKALSTGDAGVTVSATGVVPFNATHTAVAFTFSASSNDALDGFEASVKTAAKIAAVNGVLERAGFPLVLSIFGSDATNVPVETGTCTSNANGAVARCSMTSPVRTASIQVSSTGFGASPRVFLTTVVSTGTGSSRRQTSNTSEVQLNCSDGRAVTTVSDDSTLCNPTVCALALGNMTSVSAVQVLPAADTTDANGTSTDPAVTQCATARTTSFGAAPSADEPALEADSVATETVEEDEQGYFVGSTVVVSIAVVSLFVVLFVMRLVLLRQIEARASIIGHMKFLRFLPRWVRRSAVDDELRQRYRLDMGCVLVGLSVVAGVLLCIMGLMWVLWVQSREERAESSVVVTFYDSPLCAGGVTVRTLPFQAATIAAMDECGALSVVGATRSALYGRAKCATPDATSGMVALTAAEGDCTSAPLVEVARDVCIPIDAIMPNSDVALPGVFATLSCVPTGQGGDYAQFLKDESTPAPQSIRVSSTDPPESTSEATATYSYPYTTRSSSGLSTSTAQNMLATHSSFANLRTLLDQSSTSNAERHVALYQARDGSLSGAPGSLLADATAIAERETFDAAIGVAGLDASSLSSAQQRQLGKSHGGYPAGYIFNGFDSTSEAAGADAARGAQRYLSMRDSVFDLGASFNPETDDDFDAFTISMWLKASARTQGFAFVLADHYEVLGRGRGTGPVLVERLRQIVLDGPKSSRPWYNHSFNVYASFFVNGASRTVSFAMMAPNNDGVVPTGTEKAIVQWSLDDIGEGQLLNGGWHHVSLTMQNQKKKPFVALIVDGKSSLSSNKWRKCLSRRPSQLHKLSDIVVDAAPIAVSSTSEGVMYVGYLNGGVQGVTFKAAQGGTAGAIRGGTSSMRNERALRRVSLESLAFGMFTFACIAGCLVLYTIRVMCKENRSEELEDLDAARAVYAENLRQLYTRCYYPLTFDAAAEIIGADASTVAGLIQECSHQPLDDPDDPNSPKLVRALYLCARPELLRHRRSGKPKTATELRECCPTPAQWARVLSALPPSALVARSVIRELEEAEAAAAAAAKGGKQKKKKKRSAKLRLKLKIRIRTTNQSKKDKSDSKSGINTVRSGKADPNSVLLSVIGTLQVASVYMDTWTIPAIYENWISPIINITGLDFLQYAFSDPLAGPILQLCVAAILLSVLAFVFARDDVNFYRNLLRYQHRRDRLEDASAAVSERALNVLLRKIDPDFVIERPFAGEVSVQMMSGEERAAAELFLGDEQLKELEVRVQGTPAFLRKPNLTVHSSPNPKYKPHQRLVAVSKATLNAEEEKRKADRQAQLAKEAEHWLALATMPHHTATVADVPDSAAAAAHDNNKDVDSDDSVSFVSLDGIEPVIATGDGAAAGPLQGEDPLDAPLPEPELALVAEGQPMAVVSHKCPIHPKETLISEMQSNVYPYNTRRTCCILDEGKRCNAFAGQIFHCSHTNDDGEEDCGYCLCERHLQADLGAHVRMMLWNSVRRFTKRGGVWFLYYAVITIAIASYVPVMRTAVMMLACHPLYQCVFPGCYNKPTQQYVASVYFSGLLVLFYGIGFPLGLYMVLKRRQSIMAEVFASPMYLGKYLAPVAESDTHQRNALVIVKAAATRASEFLRSHVIGPCLGCLGVDSSHAHDDLAVAAPGVTSTDGRGNRLEVLTLAELCERDRDRALGLFAVKGTQEGDDDAAIGDDISERAASEGHDVHMWLDDLVTESQAAAIADGSAAREPSSPSGSNDDGSEGAADLGRSVKFAEPETSGVVFAGEAEDGDDMDEAINFDSSIYAAPSPPAGGGGGLGVSTTTSADGADPLAMSSMGMSGYFGLEASQSVVQTDAANDDATIALDRRAIQDIALLGSSVLGFPHGVLMKLQSGLVSLGEYRRFVMSDESAMILLYAQIKFESMHLVPILSCGKFLLLIPPLVLNPNSFEQLAAIAAGETFFAVFLAAYSPYHSMWMVIVVLLGNIHQFLLVGLKAYITAVSHERDASAEAGSAMVVTTLGFMAATLIIFIIMLAGDAVTEKIADLRLGRVMGRLGLTRPKGAPLLIAPINAPVRVRPTEMPDVENDSDEEVEFMGAKGLAESRREDRENAAARDFQRWQAHKRGVLRRERERRLELRSAERMEQEQGMS